MILNSLFVIKFRDDIKVANMSVSSKGDKVMLLS